MTIRPRVLVLCDYYLPGFRAGGPIRSISNTIRRLTPDVEFFVVTRDHDSDRVRHRGIESGRWTVGAEGAVYYTPRLTRAVIEACIRETDCNVIWLNSFFSCASLRVLLSRRLERVRQPILLAPRGELAPGALTFKRWRKLAGIRLLQEMGSLQSVDWLASSECEAQDISRIIGDVPITRVPESVSEPAPAQLAWPLKQRGRLRAVCASRISAMKNLHFLLDVLMQCEGVIDLDLIGPIEDPAYWAKCRQCIARLPSHITVTYLGEVVHAELMRRLPAYDVMLLPSLGENFGHVIVEAWSAGCPVLVSDRTPWRNLEEDGVGWDLPLEPTIWVDALQRCLAMTGDDLLTMRRRSVERARRVWHDGISGDEALRQLILTMTHGISYARRADDELPQHEPIADAKPCR